MTKLGLKQVPGVTRVTIRKSKNILFVIAVVLFKLHCSQKGPYYRDQVPIGTFFDFWGPYWVPIYISGSLFSVFWQIYAKNVNSVRTYTTMN